MSVSRPTLLVSRLLQLRDASPLLVLTDTIFQSAWPVLQHFAENARSARHRVITIGWRRDSDVCTIEASGQGVPKMKDLNVIIQEIQRLTQCPPPSSSSASSSTASTSTQTSTSAPAAAATGTAARQKIVLLIPDLNDFLALNPAHLSTFLSSLIAIAPGTVSITAVFHKDVPTPSYPSHLPTPTILLQYLATSIVHVESLTHVLLHRDAGRRSRTSPVTLDLEGRDIFVPLGVNCPHLVLSLDHRRKSGRGILETSVFDSATGKILNTADVPGMEAVVEQTEQVGIPDEREIGFKISLSEKEKSDRDGVILPHYVQIDDGRTVAAAAAAPVSQNSVDKMKKQEDDRVVGIGNIYYEPDSGDDFDVEDPDDDLLL